MASSQVSDFFRDKSLFITGGTGFLGICLIEKLLRCCPELKNIYLLIRPKKGKDIQQRLEEVTKNSVFGRLREEGKANLFEKLIAVAGDVGEENLGLSPADRLTLVEHVQVVFHSAATLDFEADLKTTVNINLLGTRRVVQLSQEIRDLKVLVHVSSAYVNAVRHDIEEKVYPPPTDVNELLKAVEKLDVETLNKETPKILQDHPNPYTFTKHLAEHEVTNGNLPCAIVRPSMIVAAWKEPVPGWTISKNGPQGFLLGASKGVVRRLPVAENLIYDYIPVDLVVNSLVVASYAVHRDGSTNAKVYHCTTSTCNPFKWRDVKHKLPLYLRAYPSCGAVWYPYLKLLPSIFWYRISAIFVHMIPAYILDMVTRICGGRPILVRLHTNVNRSLDRLEQFIFSEWHFHNPRQLELHETLSPDDQKLFPLDARPLVWEDYFLDLSMGVRMYLNNESPRSLAKARTKHKILLVAHLALQAALLGLVWWLAKCILGATWTRSAMIVPLTYMIFSLI